MRMSGVLRGYLAAVDEGLDLVENAIAPFWDAFQAHPASLDPHVREAMIVGLQRLVGNGGHESWLEYGTDLFPYAVDALWMLGAERHAGIAAAAMALAPPSAADAEADLISRAL